MNLYEMTEQAKALYELLDGTTDTDGMTEEEIEQIISDTMESIGADDKLNSYAKVMIELEADAEKVKKEKLRLAKIQSSLESNIERMKGAVMLYMDALQTAKTETDLFKFSIRESDVIEIEAENGLTDDFYRLEKRYDKAAIKKYLKENSDVNIKGVEIKKNRSLTVK